MTPPPLWNFSESLSVLVASPVAVPQDHNFRIKICSQLNTGKSWDDLSQPGGGARWHKWNFFPSLRSNMVNWSLWPRCAPQCNYSCNLASNLKVHMRQHSGEQPFACNQCDFSCRDLNITCFPTLVRNHLLARNAITYASSLFCWRTTWKSILPRLSHQPQAKMQLLGKKQTASLKLKCLTRWPICIWPEGHLTLSLLSQLILLSLSLSSSLS